MTQLHVGPLASSHVLQVRSAAIQELRVIVPDGVFAEEGDLEIGLSRGYRISPAIAADALIGIVVKHPDRLAKPFVLRIVLGPKLTAGRRPGLYRVTGRDLEVLEGTWSGDLAQVDVAVDRSIQIGLIDLAPSLPQ